MLGNGRTLITKTQLLGSSLVQLQAQKEREIHWVSEHSSSACVYQLVARQACSGSSIVHQCARHGYGIPFVCSVKVSMTCATYLSCPEQVPPFLLPPSHSIQRLSFLRCTRTPHTRIWLRVSHTCGHLSIRARRPSEFWSRTTSINSWRSRALLTVIDAFIIGPWGHLTYHLSLTC